MARCDALLAASPGPVSTRRRALANTSAAPSEPRRNIEAQEDRGLILDYKSRLRQAAARIANDYDVLFCTLHLELRQGARLSARSRGREGRRRSPLRHFATPDEDKQRGDDQAACPSGRSWRRPDLGTTRTCAKWTLAAARPSDRIERFARTGLAVEQARSSESQADVSSPWLSDHRAVVATVRSAPGQLAASPARRPRPRGPRR